MKSRIEHYVKFDGLKAHCSIAGVSVGQKAEENGDQCSKVKVNTGPLQNEHISSSFPFYSIQPIVTLV